MWQLVREVHNKTIINTTEAENKDEIIDQIILGNSPVLLMREFIKEYSKSKNINIVQVESILKSAIERGLIIEEDQLTRYMSLMFKEPLFHEPGLKEYSRTIRTSAKGDDFIEVIPMISGLLAEFKLWWLWIVFPMITFIVGLIIG